MVAARRPQGPQALGPTEVRPCGLVDAAPTRLCYREGWTCALQRVLCLTIALRITTSLRMQAVSAGMLFAETSQPQIEVAQRTATQDRIVRRHVQSAAQIGTTAEDVALTAPFSALASKGRHSDQGGISRELSVPNSGKRAIRTALVTRPTPGTLSSKATRLEAVCSSYARAHVRWRLFPA